jgi:hypothetical protein
MGRILTALLFAFLVLELVIFSPKKEGSEEESRLAVASQGETQEDQWANGIHMIETRDEKKEWELESKKGKIHLETAHDY